MKMTYVKLSAILLLSMLSTFVFAQSTGYPSDQLILRFEEGTTQAEQDAILDEYNLIIIDGPTPVTEFLLCKIYPNFPNLPPGAYENAQDSINGVIVVVDDEEADINGVGLARFTETPYQFHGYSNEGGNGILQSCPQNPFSIDLDNVGQGWVNVGIFDTGIAGEASLNGFLMDFPGIFNPYYEYASPGLNFVNQDPYPTDDNGHGTLMASMVVMEAGLNPYKTEMQSYKTHNLTGNGSLFNIIKAVDHSILANIDIVNMSFSYTASSEERDNLSSPLRIAIDEAEQIKGTLFIAAAGNNGNNNDGNSNVAFPASFSSPNIISVASVDCSGELSDFSNAGKKSVDIASPGEDIKGAYLDGEFGVISGTSPAAAIVCRGAALLASYQQSFDYVAIKCALINSATYHSSLGSKVLSSGYLNVEGALVELLANCQSNNGGNNGGGGTYADQIRMFDSVTKESWELDYLIDEGGVNLEIISTKEDAMKLNLYTTDGVQILHKDLNLSAGRNTFYLPFQANYTQLLILNLSTSMRQKNVKILR